MSQEPEYLVINPMHLKIVMHGYIDKHGPLKMKTKYIVNSKEIKSYYLRNIFKKNYLKGH